MKARDIRPGDELLVHRNIGRRTVASAETDADGITWVTLFAPRELVYENKATSRGPRVEYRLVEHGIRPLQADEEIDCERGDEAVARHLRAEMESAQIERWNVAEDRHARNAHRHERASDRATA